MKDMTFLACFLDTALQSAKGLQIMGYGLHNAEVYKTEHEKKNTFMNKKRTKHFVKYGSIEIHGAMSLSSRVETFSRVPTALCFCVVWMCCDFQGLIAFHTL